MYIWPKELCLLECFHFWNILIPGGLLFVCPFIEKLYFNHSSQTGFGSTIISYWFYRYTHMEDIFTHYNRLPIRSCDSMWSNNVFPSTLLPPPTTIISYRCVALVVSVKQLCMLKDKDRTLCYLGVRFLLCIAHIFARYISLSEPGPVQLEARLQSSTTPPSSRVWPAMASHENPGPVHPGPQLRARLHLTSRLLRVPHYSFHRYVHVERVQNTRRMDFPWWKFSLRSTSTFTVCSDSSECHQCGGCDSSGYTAMSRE